MTKTPNLDLPQFVGTDPVRYTDFNDAFMKLDSAVPLVEEGTWTPRLSARNGSAPSYNIDYNYGQYYKIGKLVFIAFHFKGNITNAGTGTAVVAGLPFIPNDKSDGFGLSARETFGALETHPARAFIPANDPVIWIQNATGAEGNKYKTGQLYVGFSGCYVTEN